MFRWFRHRFRAVPQEAETSAATLIRSLCARVTAPGRAAQVLARASSFGGLSPAAQLRELTATYLLLEHYLVEIDAASLPREALRARVRARHPELLSDPRFGVIFEPEGRQEVLLCRFMLARALERAAELLGTAPGQSLTALQSWLLLPSPVPPVPLIGDESLPESESEWVSLLERLGGALYVHVEAALGERSAIRIFEAGYQETFETYSGLDTFPVVIGLLPEKVLDEEKIVLLSRRQVQRLVRDHVDRLQRVNEQLNTAKEELEERIAERTRKLRESNESLRREVAERQRAEEALGRSEKYFRSLIENGSDVILLLGPADELAYVSPSAERVLEYRCEELIGRNVLELVHPEERTDLALQLARLIETGEMPGSQTVRLQRPDGAWRVMEIRATVFPDHPSGAAVVLNARDITESRQLEAQLHQAQKMDAVGRLAGGIAHDFNNLLTAINGYATLLLDDLPAGSDQRADMEEIRHAADRAAGLTGQLLAFSRRQVLQPKVIDLDATVREMERMLRRMIGEDVALLTRTEPNLGRVRADPGQISQVLMNLVVNARDAMPAGGTLTLTTANVDLDREYVRGHMDVKSGSYVMLAVSDTGSGMDEQTRAQIFEPFFTTKPVGKGTGLGLSTVYGIVKQSGGVVWVYSEPGQGTTFKIYLPRVDESLDAAPRPALPATKGRSATVLLVEDEGAVRALAQRVLERSGYSVLVAENGAAALGVAEAHAGTIDLLLTDVVMPELGGRDLADRLRALHPGLSVLFMSGYIDDAVLRGGKLPPGAAFLEKPFSPNALLRRVQEALDEATAELLAT